MDSDKKNALSILALVSLMIMLAGLGAGVRLVQQRTSYLSKAAAPSPNKLFCDSLTLNPTTGTAPLTVTATISARVARGEKIVAYQFNFGDGSGEVRQAKPTLSHTFQNPGTFLVKGYVIGKLSGQVGGIGTCQKSLIVSQSGGITVEMTLVEVVLSRANAQNGLVFGKGFTLTSQGATTWQLRYSEPTQGQGFYESSGGITPGSSVAVRSYINANKPNGVYHGYANVQYYQNNVWQDGPVLTYTITLTD